MKRRWLIALSIPLTLVSGMLVAQSVQTIQAPDQVTKILTDAGYAGVRDIELEKGLWEAEVRADDGRWHDVHVVAATGELLDDRSDRALMTAADITAGLQKAGYTNIHDLDLDDAVWEADATRPNGQRVELHLNGYTGQVIHEEPED